MKCTNYRREERSVPFIITSCVREVERRGMTEVGIYRVSGSSSDLTKLKKSFESSEYDSNWYAFHPTLFPPVPGSFFFSLIYCA